MTSSVIPEKPHKLCSGFVPAAQLANIKVPVFNLIHRELQVLCKRYVMSSFTFLRIETKQQITIVIVRSLGWFKYCSNTIKGSTQCEMC